MPQVFARNNYVDFNSIILDTVLSIPLNNGESYEIPFHFIPHESNNDNANVDGFYIADDILKWKLLLGIDNIEEKLSHWGVLSGHTPDEDVLDLSYRQILALIHYLQTFAPDGYTLSLPKADDWIQAFNCHAIHPHNNVLRYVELTETWDYDHCLPMNSISTGVAYVTFELDRSRINGYMKKYDSEGLDGWLNNVGIRLVLKLTPEPQTSITSLVSTIKDIATFTLEKLNH